MRAFIDTAPSNSVVLVMDRSVGIVPNSMGGGLIAATSTCVAIGTLSEWDGETRIALMDEPSIRGPESLVFDGVLATPGRVLSVCTVLDDILLETSVSEDRTRVRIWANDEVEPSEIEIEVSPVEA